MIDSSCDSLKDGPEGAGAQSPVQIPDKRYFKIGEVCEITGIKQHVLRYWESEFKMLSPARARSKQRLYRREDVENVLRIKRLLKDEGFTIQGAKKALSREGGELDGAAAAMASGGEGSASATGIFAEVKAELVALKKILEG
ncbi:MerR family transcriptional regulator [Thiovibrio sp. JS02]